MQYAKVIDGNVNVGLPSVGQLKDGNTVSGYNLLDKTTLKAEGWLPFVEDKPSFDPATQYLSFDEYVISADTITARYSVVDIIPQPITPSIDEKVADLEAQNAQVIFTLVSNGLM